MDSGVLGVEDIVHFEWSRPNPYWGANPMFSGKIFDEYRAMSQKRFKSCYKRLIGSHNYAICRIVIFSSDLESPVTT